MNGKRSWPQTLARQSGIVLALFMNFSDLICFISRARLVISGDTLALHLADMTRTPAVGIFGPSSPQRNGPLLPAQPGDFQGAGVRFLLPAEM